jgi:predicted GIY-YIG superfamily endonuclease
VVEDVSTAKLREKQIKRSPKKKRISLIEAMNPEWEDLYSKLRWKKITTTDLKDTKDK